MLLLIFMVFIIFLYFKKNFFLKGKQSSIFLDIIKNLILNFRIWIYSSASVQRKVLEVIYIYIYIYINIY